MDPDDFLIDLTGISLDELIGTDDTVIRRAVSRAAAETADGVEVLSAFDNYAGDDGPVPA